MGLVRFQETNYKRNSKLEVNRPGRAGPHITITIVTKKDTHIFINSIDHTQLLRQRW